MVRREEFEKIEDAGDDGRESGTLNESVKVELEGEYVGWRFCSAELWGKADWPGAPIESLAIACAAIFKVTLALYLTGVQ